MPDVGGDVPVLHLDDGAVSQLSGAPAAGAFPYTPNIDKGFVTYDNAGHLHGIQWTTARGGIQYYFPNNGKVWIAGNYSHIRARTPTTTGRRQRLSTTSTGSMPSSWVT